MHLLKKSASKSDSTCRNGVPAAINVDGGYLQQIMPEWAYWMRVSNIFKTKLAYRVRVSNIEKNIHSKNHAFGEPIVLTLKRNAHFWEPFSKNTFDIWFDILIPGPPYRLMQMLMYHIMLKGSNTPALLKQRADFEGWVLKYYVTINEKMDKNIVSKNITRN